MKSNATLALTARRLVPVMSAVLLALLMIPSALSQCGLPTKSVKPSSWHPQMEGARLMNAALKSDGDEEHLPSIVGMWHVTFTAQTLGRSAIPNTVIDNALVVWHSDNTEIMNSVRPPQDGNFCMGVWEQTGKNKYFLNHFAWFANAFPNNTDNGIGDPTGPTRITEKVTLSPDGDHFTGTFTLDAYDTSGNISQAFTGVLAATRITTRTKTGDLL
jgi:hypothetical protein